MRRILLISAAMLLPFVAGCVTPAKVGPPEAQPPTAYQSTPPNPDSLTPYFVSNAYEKIWGFPCESAYAVPSTWIESIHPDDRESAIRHMGQAEPFGHNQMEYRIIRPDGEVRWIWVRSFPMKDDAGGSRRVIGIAQEALTNAVRHARAQRITIRASTVNSLGLRLSIADDGRGIPRERASSGFGMTSMQERAERIGASLTIVTAPRSGTEVVLAWEPAALPTQIHAFN